ncbi:hypothetical protein SAMN05444008_102408 [Cnuella takakiae]|uniref:Helix-turn-helix domain-containing protein n=1 Tax=Cnuella takakiae TaxID=1302690 RepID=A0A1M4VWK5_9BACT|nr:hypothetical protein [Cnuella takakiae]OLY92476.1 hypothetical protein BUE76_11700 [Cnuella takakiae]SHE73346.1 hypothetical protein SAMN05444008_102408 [Cnuella takakiae]
MKETTYHNTTNLSAQELMARVQRASKQKDAVLLIFLAKRGQKYAASQVHRSFTKAGKTWPITSIRRAMTDLMNEGHLVKLDETRIGPYNDPEHLYTLNIRKYPTPQDTIQSNLFQ